MSAPENAGSFRRELHSSDPEVIWAAGFIEGEGYFTVKKAVSWMLGVGQVNREPLDRLAAIFEAGRIYQRTKVKQDGANRRSWWGWEVTDKQHVLRITRLVAPWLTANRRERIPWIEQAWEEPCYVTDPPAPENGGSNLERYRIFRLCECPECEGTGKVRNYALPKNERCPECRGEGRVRQEIATCPSPEALGVALVTLGREGEFEECPVGVLDSEGAIGEKWIIRPWLPSARNVSDAARTLAKSRGGRS